MSISTLPTFPDRGLAPESFQAAAAAWGAALVTFGAETNAQAVAMDAAAVIADEAAGIIAETKWISGTTYALGDVVWSPADYQSYRRIVAGAGTTDPSADGTNWLNITSKSRMTRSARTSNTALATSDHGKLIEITTGGFTQTFDAAATLGAGWWAILYNSSSSEVQLDPNSTEQIDGLASYYMYAGECRLIICTGTAFYSVVYKPFFQRFLSDFTFTKPPGYKAFGVRLWGGGGSGQRTNSAATLSVGGGGGGCTEAIVPASLLDATESVTIGQGGAAVTTVAAGNVGTDTNFATSLLVGYGAGAGIGGSLASVNANSPVGFEGGSATATPGKAIYGGGASSSNASAASADSVYGGAAGGSVDGSGNLRAAGTSLMGGSGGAASIAGNGTDGSVPGGGGGATQTGTQSGAGGNGAVEVWGHA